MVILFAYARRYASLISLEYGDHEIFPTGSVVHDVILHEEFISDDVHNAPVARVRTPHEHTN